jgi:hypothetical protein
MTSTVLPVRLLMDDPDTPRVGNREILVHHQRIERSDGNDNDAIATTRSSTQQQHSVAATQSATSSHSLLPQLPLPFSVTTIDTSAPSYHVNQYSNNQNRYYRPRYPVFIDPQRNKIDGGNAPNADGESTRAIHPQSGLNSVSSATSEVVNSSSSLLLRRSSSYVKLASLHGNLMRTHHRRDPFKYVL